MTGQAAPHEPVPFPHLQINRGWRVQFSSAIGPYKVRRTRSPVAGVEADAPGWPAAGPPPPPLNASDSHLSGGRAACAESKYSTDRTACQGRGRAAA